MKNLFLISAFFMLLLGGADRAYCLEKEAQEADGSASVISVFETASSEFSDPFLPDLSQPVLPDLEKIAEDFRWRSFYRVLQESGYLRFCRTIFPGLKDTDLIYPFHSFF